MTTRTAFLRGIATLPLLGVAGAVDWSFPGIVAVWAQRLRDERPFLTRNPDVVFPAASIIKLPIFLAVGAKLRTTHSNWEKRLRIAASDIVAGSETFGSAHAGEAAAASALARAMITQSDNTAANVLANFSGFALVNSESTRLGAPHTLLARHFMDFEERARGIDNLTTARDMAAIVRAIALARTEDCRLLQDLMLRQEDRETIPAAITRKTKIANKTGELPGVRHDVAIVDIDSTRAYVMVLLSNGFTKRTEAVARLRAIAATVDFKEGT